MAEIHDRRMVVTLLIDETGSMMPRRDITLSGVNEYLDTLKAAAQPDDIYIVSIVTFNSEGIRMVVENAPLADVPRMTRYSPQHNTPLYDAVGGAIVRTEEYMTAHPLAGDGAYAPLLLIVTDGEENSSTEYAGDQIRQMVEARQAAGTWTFVFMGCDLDQWATNTIRQSVGTRAANTVSYAAGDTVRASSSAATMTANMLGHYRSTGARATTDANSFRPGTDPSVPLVGVADPPPPPSRTRSLWSKRR